MSIKHVNSPILFTAFGWQFFFHSVVLLSEFIDINTDMCLIDINTPVTATAPTIRSLYMYIYIFSYNFTSSLSLSGHFSINLIPYLIKVKLILQNENLPNTNYSRKNCTHEHQHFILYFWLAFMRNKNKANNKLTKKCEIQRSIAI